MEFLFNFLTGKCLNELFLVFLYRFVAHYSRFLLKKHDVSSLKTVNRMKNGNTFLGRSQANVRTMQNW